MKLKETNGGWRRDLKKNEVVQNCYDKNCEENGCGKEWSIPSQIGVFKL